MALFSVASVFTFFITLPCKEYRRQRFWDLTQGHRMRSLWCFKELLCLQGQAVQVGLHEPLDKGTKTLWNVRNYSPNNTAPHPTYRTWTFSRATVRQSKIKCLTTICSQWTPWINPWVVHGEFMVDSMAMCRFLS